ncbi:ATP-binding protein [Bacillus haynesii]|uniref:ATP-binding protein n=1 Tax=Bacillus haynesii TaxID=1925021 RepID=UPI0022803B36|nr:ATP-binding protein [Bacillus haynesii]MCY8673437.1 ATP-binding protein [Bacillus haynesii]
MKENWESIGTVVGNTNTLEYAFILKSFKSRVGDIVALKMRIPSEDYKATKQVYVWGRISSIERVNPFFPFEAAQELSDTGINLIDTVLSNTRDQLQASVIVLGYTHEDDSNYSLYPVTYPIEPAKEVLFPPTNAVSSLLQGERDLNSIFIGSLISRGDVNLSIRANPIVARHMAILAMTGGGKTVASRRIIREFANKGYPLLIIDPHGDYLSLAENAGNFPSNDIKLFYPYVKLSESNEYILKTLITKMTKGGLTEAQQELFDMAMERTSLEGEIGIRSYIHKLDGIINSIDVDGRLVRSKGAVRRALRFVDNKLEAMERSNQQLRSRLDMFSFLELPDPSDEPNEIIAPGQISILYLGGYDHLTQSTIVSILMDNLFEHRASMANIIPPFFTVIEEAHNFIPSHSEGLGSTPSIESIRRIITEGRKFGTGLLLISQRPSRLDQTILSQCNTFLILRLVNPKDQNFVRQVMENLSESDAKMLPSFGPGQGLISGQAVRFPLLIKIQMDKDLIPSTLGDENFISQVEKWGDSPEAKTVSKSKAMIEFLERKNKRGKKRGQ